MGDDAIPDYRQRLAYGTDQGRWLMQQQGVARQKRRQENSASVPSPKLPAAARRRAPPPRAYHQLDDGVGAVINSPLVRTRERSGIRTDTAALNVIVIVIGCVALGGLLAVGRLVMNLDDSAQPWILPDAAGP
eukprot:scaffold244842_cov44-Tisochrysis_lutea.AAC.1